MSSERKVTECLRSTEKKQCEKRCISISGGALYSVNDLWALEARDNPHKYSCLIQYCATESLFLHA